MLYNLLALAPDHFHVHIVNANYVGLAGMSVGQAHLLDDIISMVSHVHNFVYQPCLLTDRSTQSLLYPGIVYSRTQLELDPKSGPSIFERMTLTYGLGDQHGLFEQMRIVQGEDGASNEAGSS